MGKKGGMGTVVRGIGKPPGSADEGGARDWGAGDGGARDWGAGDGGDK
jgi:hypothetical protein